MPESVLSFASSSSFRDTLIARNLAPYQVQGVYTPPPGNVTYEVSPLNDSNVIDSPDNLISTNQLSNNLYPLNQWGPDGGFQGKYSIGNLVPVPANEGPYDPTDTVLDLINEFYIDAAYVTNIYGPEGGYKDLVIITDVQLSTHYYLPYFDGVPTNFIPSTYTPYAILFSDNPSGDNGTLSQDSYIAKTGALYLREYFEERIAQEFYQITLGSANLSSLQDPFSASMLATGQQPFFTKNWKITVPENPLLAAVSFANRLTGTYFPVSFIPGDYFDDPDPVYSPQTENALNTVNNLTGGALGGVLNKFRNPSEIFLANTGNGQQSVLFKSLEYNLYRPNYDKPPLQQFTSAISNLFGVGPNGGGGYYVGSEEAEPSLITQPANQVAVNYLGVQQGTLVYGPSELGKLFEGNEGKINFGLQAESYSNQGGITGKFVWTSPKYKENAGWKVGPGGDPKIIDGEFNEIQNSYNQNLSTDIEFRGGSILDQTQRIINAADNVGGAARLKHAGNAMNQVSKVFNDGYKEMTKGSQVIAYYDSSTGEDVIGIDGIEVGREYCRVFQKDTPYLTYADLQKTDGITKSGRKFNNSVLDNTYNLNIAPIRNPGSTNIVDSKVKKYMFSLENLAWRTSDQPGYTYDDLPTCEKGPNGGRIMWFPPYDISFNEDVRASWNPTKFLGRPEPIYTYANTTRSGSISWKIVVDTPSAMNTIIEKQLANRPAKEVDSIIDSFFAGCVKYDIYDLAAKFNTIPTSELYTYQQLLNEPRLTEEELGSIYSNISKDKSTNIGTNGNGNTEGGDGSEPGPENEDNDTINTDETESVDITSIEKFIDYSFYFDNDYPEGQYSEAVTASQPYDYWYNQYLSVKGTKYITNPPEYVYVGTKKYENKSVIQKFYNDIIIGNYQTIQTDFLNKLKEIIVDKNGSVKIELQGSASAPAKINYNRNLSKRRINSVTQWFRNQTIGDKTIATLESEGKITFIENFNGEEITIPQKDGSIFEEVDCTKNITMTPTENPTSGDINNSSIAQWYSIPAMACRRVRIARIEPSVPKPPSPPPGPPPPPSPPPGPPPPPPPGPPSPPTPPTPPGPKPVRRPDPIKKVKEGISKKILRYLFSECDYFEVIKETNPMVYDTIKEKIKYFSPAFHSTTPEGLNARLTFLNQCMRPGQTIPVIGPDGRPKHNDALNTSFGAPPVLVLRIGDFYHTKIIPNSISITYDPLVFDINPEGIGVQPMIAKVSLGFDFIGGSGLAGPVEQLQNALSFNYYANTEIYDERALATEDTSERDEKIVGKLISNGSAPLTVAQIPNEVSNRGGQTVGTIISTNANDDGTIETGEIDYNNLISELSTGTKEFFSTIYNQLKSIKDVSNYGILQLVNYKRKYFDGNISEFQNSTPLKIYGKPDSVEKLVKDIVDQAVKDCKNELSPVLKEIVQPQSLFSNAQQRQIKNKMEEILGTRNAEINNVIIGPINDLTSYQENFNYTFRKTDVVISKFDGILLESGEPKVYSLTGDSATTVTTAILDVYTNQVGKTITEFFDVMSANYIMNNGSIEYSPSPVNLWNLPDKWFKSFTTQEEQRFYIVMSDIMLDDNKYNSFIESLTSLDKIKPYENLVNDLKARFDFYKIKCKLQRDNEDKIFADYEASPEYQKFQSFEILPFEAKVGYTTNKNEPNYATGVDRIKKLYSKQNLNNDDKYNGKVKFN
jgi:hypothetical protein